MPLAPPVTSARLPLRSCSVTSRPPPVDPPATARADAGSARLARHGGRGCPRHRHPSPGCRPVPDARRATRSSSVRIGALQFRDGVHHHRPRLRLGSTRRGRLLVAADRDQQRDDGDRAADEAAECTDPARDDDAPEVRRFREEHHLRPLPTPSADQNATSMSPSSGACPATPTSVGETYPRYISEVYLFA